VGEWTTAGAQGLIGPNHTANLPDRAIWFFPEAWNDNPFEIIYNVMSPATVSPPYSGKYSAETLRYMRESLIESRKRHLADWRDILKLATVYNFSFIWVGPQNMRPVLGGFGDGSRLYFPTLHSTLGGLALPNTYQPPMVDPDPLSAEGRLRAGSERHVDLDSRARKLCLRISSFFLSAWPILAAASLVAGLAALFVMPQLVPLWLFWLALVASTSWIGMATDRYVAIVEPLLYLLCGAVLAAAVRRQTGSRSPC
jgi:hypothetical protein